MAKKVRCGGCGAKNKADLDRCRVCGAPILKAVEGAGQADSPDDAPHLPEVPVSDLPAIYEEEFQTIELPPGKSDMPPSPTRDNPLYEETDSFSLDELSIDLKKYGSKDGTPVVQANAHFDTEELKVEKKRIVPALADDAPKGGKVLFDPDALVIEDPTDPKPS